MYFTKKKKKDNSDKILFSLLHLIILFQLLLFHFISTSSELKKKWQKQLDVCVFCDVLTAVNYNVIKFFMKFKSLSLIWSQLAKNT